MVDTVKILRDYWRAPDDGVNSPLSYLVGEDAQQRSCALVAVVKRLFPDRSISILELGSGTGRNLHYLKNAGYHNLLGIELSPKYIATMKEYFPKLSEVVVEGSIEDVLPNFVDKFDIVFSMAVLEHIPIESEFVFGMIVGLAKHLLTIEDERCESWRHFPRNYQDVFSVLGMEYIKGWQNIPGLSSAFVMRLFTQGDEEK